GPADSAVVFGAAVGRAHDQWLAQPVAQGLQLVHGLGVDPDRAGAAAGDLGGRKARPAPRLIGNVAPSGIGQGRHGESSKWKNPPRGGPGGRSVLIMVQPRQGALPKIFSLIAIPASSARMTPVVIRWTALWTAVRRTKRMASSRARRSRISRAA